MSLNIAGFLLVALGVVVPLFLWEELGVASLGLLALPLLVPIFSMRRYFWLLVLTAANLNAVKMPEPLRNLDVVVTAITIIIVIYYLLKRKSGIPLYIVLPMTAFLACSAIGCFYSPVPMDSLGAWIRNLYYLLIAGLAYQAIRPSIDLTKTVWVFLAASVPPAALGIYQAFTGSGLIINEESVQAIDTGFTRAFGFMSHANFLAFFLMQIILIGIIYLREERNLSSVSKLVLITILALDTCCLYYTYTRGALLGLLLGISLYVVLRRDWTLAAAGILLGGAPLLIPGVSNRLMDVFNFDKLMTASSFSWRLDLWASLLQLFESQPIFGSGLKSVVYFTSYAVHNEYMALLVETGVPGLLAMLTVLACLWGLAIRTIKLSLTGVNAVFPFAFISILLATTVTAFGDNVFSVPSSYVYFWMVTGIVMAIHRSRSAVSTPNDPLKADLANAHET